MESGRAFYYLKGNARLNLTLEGTNTLVGLDDGARCEVGKDATLVITDRYPGDLKAVGRCLWGP